MERRSLSSVLADARDRGSERRTMATGFPPLDRVIGGGLRTRNLTLIGGAPGIGKTITALQMARNLAYNGQRTVFACYEHDEVTLLSRLLHLELAELPTEQRMGQDGRFARRILGRVEAGDLSLGRAIAEAPVLQGPYATVSGYADSLWLVRASGLHTDIAQLAGLVGDDTDALFVDYLQKVPVTPAIDDEGQRVTVVSHALKDLAMRANIAVVAIAASDGSGLRARRLRMHHLGGSASLAYEADVVLLMNEKFDIVSRSQMTHDLTAAESFKNQVVFTVEKNRDGADMVDLQFRKQYEYLRLDPAGETLNERLIDERLITE
jgi:replicative DNA helicase